MKAALLFIAIAIAVATLACGTSSAATTDDTKTRQEFKPPVRQVGHGSTPDKHARESIPLPKPAKPPRSSSNRKGGAPSKSVNAPRPASEPGNRPMNAGVVARHDSVKTHSARTLTASRPPVPSQNTVRHHSANPASIGGPQTATISSTAALDGRLVSRKP
jgi:hypothetical protein